MEKNVGIWLDSEKAYIISLVDGREELETIESNVESRVRYKGEKKSFSRIGGQLFNPQKKKTKRKKHQLHSYYQDILKKTKNAGKIYIFGPAEAKTGLNKEYTKHKELQDKILRVESSDSLTENQMIARVREVFAKAS
ncbi:MAG: hypothetical protein IIB05_03280 [Bacteroidetes bacterium]|nr:hypothetical protein [Bacteroidota bacterium]